MCYSAQIVSEWKVYVRNYGVHLSLQDYVDLFWRRAEGARLKIPKGIDDGFVGDADPNSQPVRSAILQWRAQEVGRLEQELFKQRRRLADAERSLGERVTKKATDDARIAASKVTQIVGWLADLHRSDSKSSDARIYPQHYTHVIVSEGGRRVLKPMRYGCRLAGKPASYDTRYPGTYNSRRDRLEEYWRAQFGRDHAVLVATAFFENVDRDGQNVVLEFRPNTSGPMLVACLWSRWTKEGEDDLMSFAAITDEPPAEVSAAGHDRCIIPIRPENLDAWLNPNPGNLAASYAILDDRERPFYEHRLVA